MVNLLNNGTFESGISGWSGSQSTQAWGNDGGHIGSGYLLMTSNGTGTRSCSSSPVAVTEGQVYSAGAYGTWKTGATPRQAAADIQWLDAVNAVVATDNGATITTVLGSWQQSAALNKVCPSGLGVVSARVRLRMLGAVATTEQIGWDSAQLNVGATLDPLGETPYALTRWVDGVEVPYVLTRWVDGVEVPFTLARST